MIIIKLNYHKYKNKTSYKYKMPNCDLGRPCDCSDCSDSRLQTAKTYGCVGIKKSERCKKETKHYVGSHDTNREGLSSYYTIGYCDEHYIIYEKDKEAEEARKLIEEENRSKILQEINEVEYLIKQFDNMTNDLSFNQIPIKYANNIFCYYCSMDMDLFKFDRNKLNIQKENGRWKCCKNRVDLFIKLGLDKYCLIEDPRKK
jgi:hypothetical protein